jgi:hypothetical protein
MALHSFACHFCSPSLAFLSGRLQASDVLNQRLSPGFFRGEFRPVVVHVLQDARSFRIHEQDRCHINAQCVMKCTIPHAFPQPLQFLNPRRAEPTFDL